MPYAKLLRRANASPSSASSLHVPASEKKRLLPREHLGTHVPANPVVRVVAHDRRNIQQQTEYVDIEAESLRREEPGSHEQRVARQQKPEEQPRFDEDDRSESNVPGPLDERWKVAKAVDQVGQEFHCGAGTGKTRAWKFSGIMASVNADAPLMTR